ncbi:RagB/SusD family nutrient uptake outer membrane protein [Mucilaginibacter sp. AW1-7]|uniref:RagB/SusD family nutrient uptake outer membrane protein n=1 Tax=unclassified Mucilaginibacter TaxID=2617802 RepID=UPI0008CFD3E1|nr:MULTISPECIES: RagB/SusD family nutrient uptake outer membrane protein [unclassified Mucilaginibacter]WDF76740.1 RagB/SusD family nutrient uptake outer membrane protein [Mucilaginibacter sp. KACC 22773]SEP31200.1 Starch-binding associating with outer membrane [Mucilaginibacter sp. OK283]
MKKILISICIISLAASCTKVNEHVYDKYTADQFYSTAAGADDALANVYSKITGSWGSNYAGRDNCWYDLNSFSSDEQVIPHRNTGDWQLDFAQLYTRTELPNLGIINNTWNWAYSTIYSANLAIAQLTSAKADPAKIAEAKVMRAWIYYLLIDDFGDVPFYTDNNTNVSKIPQAKRADVYNFVVNELKANVDLLSETRGGAYYGRFNKWAGYMVLAKVYLNAQVYTGTPHWAEALAAANKVASGGFTLHAAGASTTAPLGNTYYDLFGDVCPNDETIFALYITQNVISGNIYTIRSLNSPNGVALIGFAGWNGTIIPSEYYDKFDNADVRKKQFLVGAQAGGITYTKEVSSLIDPGAGPNEGIRDDKFFPVKPSDGSGESNDFPVYRYADVLLMQAECNVRLGNVTAAAPFLNQVRERAGLSDIAAPTLDNIYDERGFELNMEGHRRQDMIRFGKFLLPHGFVQTTPAYRMLFPIPTEALNANTTLKQNPGY